MSRSRRFLRLARRLTQGNFGYLGADFVAPANTVNGNNTFNLNSADLKNHNNKFEAANGANARRRSDRCHRRRATAKGHYDLSSCSGASAKCRAHPYDWAEPVSTRPRRLPIRRRRRPIRSSVPQTCLLYTCYANAKIARADHEVLHLVHEEHTVQEVPDGLLTKNGLASLPTPWRVAITETFTNNSSGLNLNDRSRPVPASAPALRAADQTVLKIHHGPGESRGHFFGVNDRCL